MKNVLDELEGGVNIGAEKNIKFVLKPSTRKITATLNISLVLVWRILLHHLMYPYHIQRIQARPMT